MSTATRKMVKLSQFHQTDEQVRQQMDWWLHRVKDDPMFKRKDVHKAVPTLNKR